MKSTLAVVTLACLALLLIASPASAQSGIQSLSAERDDYVSDASYWLATFQPKATQHTPEQMADAANKLVESLNDKLRAKLTHDLDSGERKEWTNLPSFNNPKGLRLGDLDEKQVQAACQLLATLLSAHGYQKMRDIMLADDQLLDRGRPRDGFGTECYYLVLFGSPSATEPWAFQLDGHHIGINVSVTGDDYSLSPSFIGTQPQTFKIAEQSIRPLTGEIDDAYRFVNSLSDDQRKQAVVSTGRRQILTGPGNDGMIPESNGLSCSSLDDNQKEILFRLIDQWISDLPPDHAAKRTSEVQNELGEMVFVWNGEIEEGSDISYRIQSPSLIIEYACQNMGGDPQQHLHTMYRNPANEYGGQIEP